jgi:hypothetical protein
MRSIPTTRRNLAPYRLVHFIVLAFFINRFLPRTEGDLNGRCSGRLSNAGSNLLEVFCVGVFLAVGAHVALVEVSDAI